MSTEFVLIELLKFSEPHVASNVRYIAFSMKSDLSSYPKC